MRPGWREARLGDACVYLNRGVSPKYIDEGGICVLGQRCVRDHEVKYANARRHDLSAKRVPADRFVQVGDVLVNSTGVGSLGRVAQVREAPPEPTTVDSHVTIVRPNPDEFFVDFFGYAMIAIEDAITDAGEGCGGQTELGRRTLAESFTVRYPAAHREQQRIVTILDEAFEGIAVAKAIAERNAVNARAAFESELRSVFAQAGEGWRPGVQLSELLSQQPRNGWSPPKAYQTGAGVPVLTLSAVTGFEYDGTRVKMTSAPTRAGAHYWLQEGELLITRSNTPALVGHVALYDGNPSPAICCDLIMKMKVDPAKALSRFIYYYLRSPEAREYLMSQAQGANPTMIKINKGVVQSLRVPQPPLHEQWSVVSRLDAILGESRHLEAVYLRKVEALDALKKSLLNEAFAGNL